MFLRNVDNGNIVAWSENLAKRTNMEIYDPDAADKRARAIMKDLKKLEALGENGDIDPEQVASARTVIGLVDELEALNSQLSHKVEFDKSVNRQNTIDKARMPGISA